MQEELRRGRSFLVNTGNLNRVGELAAVMTDSRPARVADARRLLAGYAGPIRQEWADGKVAVVCSGAAGLSVFDDIVVAVEGRLDNRAEIAGLLRAETASIAELVAVGWRRYGADVVDRLVGDLAAVVIDRRSELIHAFRDLCAGRPLHASRCDGGWTVASEWQPLLAAAGLPRRPDREWFASAFVGHSINPKATPYDGVEMILPGHLASPSKHGWSQIRAASWEVPTLRDTRPGAYAEQFRELFDQAVRCRIGDGADRIGVSLSGGLDSTSVLATAHAIDPEVERTALCLPLTDPIGDERPVQAFMAQRCQSELRWVDMSRLGPFGTDGAEALFERFGAPPQVINWFYGDALASEASTAGVPVAFDGEDGDGSVGGSLAFLSDLLATGRWRRWLRETNQFRESWALGGREILRDSFDRCLPSAVRLAHARSLGDRLVPDQLAPSLAEHLELEARLQRRFLSRASLGKVFSAAQAEVGSTEHMAPKYTAISEPWRRRGVELTHPWTDRRLMSFCMGLPYVHVMTEAKPKIVLRQAMAQRLPSLLVESVGKAAMSEVVQRAVAGPDRSAVQDGLALAGTQPEWFSADGVRTLADEVESGNSYGMATRVAMFARWLRWCEAA